MTLTEFTEFVERTQSPLLRFATVLCGDAARADDLVSDVLGRAYERWDRIGGLDQPNAYVCRMIVNEYLSWRRRSWRTLAHRWADLVLIAGQLNGNGSGEGPSSAELTKIVAALTVAPDLADQATWFDAADAFG